VKRKMSYRWHLRQLMATRNMFATTDLVGPLAERGIELSREQVYRLVVGTPERLNLHVLAALCDILGCSPAELIEPVVETRQTRKAASGGQATGEGDGAVPRPVRARLAPRHRR
jgi:DNA-binding Xre family transcriptional regulator